MKKNNGDKLIALTMAGGSILGTAGFVAINSGAGEHKAYASVPELKATTQRVSTPQQEGVARSLDRKPLNTNTLKTNIQNTLAKEATPTVTLGEAPAVTPSKVSPTPSSKATVKKPKAAPAKKAAAKTSGSETKKEVSKVIKEVQAIDYSNPTVTATTYINTNSGKISVSVPHITAKGVDASQEATVRSEILALAASQNGVPYVWGGSAPGVGLDCSGLTSWAYSRVGIYLPRTADQQYRATRSISAGEAKAGDLVFLYDSGGHVYHTGILVDPVKKTYWEANHPGGSTGYRSYAYANNVYYGTVFSGEANQGDITIPKATVGKTTPISANDGEPNNYNPDKSHKDNKPVSGDKPYQNTIPSTVKKDDSSTATPSSGASTKPSTTTSSNGSTTTSTTTSSTSTSSGGKTSTGGVTTSGSSSATTTGSGTATRTPTTSTPSTTHSGVSSSGGSGTSTTPAPTVTRSSTSAISLPSPSSIITPMVK